MKEFRLFRNEVTKNITTFILVNKYFYQFIASFFLLYVNVQMRNSFQQLLLIWAKSLGTARPPPAITTMCAEHRYLTYLAHYTNIIIISILIR